MSATSIARRCWAEIDLAALRHNFAAVFELFEQDRDAVTVLLNAEQGAVDRPAAALSDVRRFM